MAAHLAKSMVLAKGGRRGLGHELRQGALLAFNGFAGPGPRLTFCDCGPLDGGEFFEAAHRGVRNGGLFAVSEFFGRIDGAPVNPNFNFKRDGVFGVLLQEATKGFSLAKFGSNAGFDPT